MAELLNTNIVASRNASETSVLNVKKNNKNSILDIRENGDIIITTADGIRINIAEGAINISDKDSKSIMTIAKDGNINIASGAINISDKDSNNIMTVAKDGISFTKFPTSSISPSISIDDNKIKLASIVSGISSQGKTTTTTINSGDLGSLRIGSTIFKIGNDSTITANDILELDGEIPYVNGISSSNGSNGGSKIITRTLNTNNKAIPVLDNIVISGGNLTGNENKAVKLDGNGNIISSGYILGNACTRTIGTKNGDVPTISVALDRKGWFSSFNR